MNETKVKRDLQLVSPDARGALAELVRSFGYDPWQIQERDLQGIADKLTQIGKPRKPWGWRYLRNILNDHTQAGANFTRAVFAIGAMQDGMSSLVAQARQMNLYVVGTVHPGAVVLGDSRPCSNPACPVHFVPRVWNQRYCSKECKRIYAKVNGKA